MDNLAKGMLERSERQKAHLAFHDMSTCHFETNDELDKDDIEVEELVADDDENGGE